MGKSPKTRRAVLDSRSIAHIRAETMLDERAIRRWQDGDKVRPATDIAIRNAMAKLDIPAGVPE